MTQKPSVLSICTGMGLLDKAFIDAGFDVIAGCEIDPEKRAMYEDLCGSRPLVHDLSDLPAAIAGRRFDGIIGGPSCQAHSRTKAFKDPKYPDLTPLVNILMNSTEHSWFILENVVAIDLEVKHSVSMCNAMHYYQPHQSRPRYFTHSSSIKAPRPVFRGDIDTLMAYPTVSGKLYGPHRAARLQGYPEASLLPFKCECVQHGLADAVPYPLAAAWAQSVIDCAYVVN